MRLPRLTVGVASVVILVDAVSKVLVAHWLVPGRVVHVGSLLELNLYYNHAGARNLLTGRPVVVAVLSILATLALVALAARARSRGISVGLGLLTGGGIGNLLDRLFGGPSPLRGGVIDWLSPAGSGGSMNLADVAINLGLLVLVCVYIRRSWIARRVAPGSGSPSGITAVSERPAA